MVNEIMFIALLQENQRELWYKLKAFEWMVILMILEMFVGNDVIMVHVYSFGFFRLLICLISDFFLSFFFWIVLWCVFLYLAFSLLLTSFISVTFSKTAFASKQSYVFFVSSFNNERKKIWFLLVSKILNKNIIREHYALTLKK